MCRASGALMDGFTRSQPSRAGLTSYAPDGALVLCTRTAEGGCATRENQQLAFISLLTKSVGAFAPRDVACCVSTLLILLILNLLWRVLLGRLGFAGQGVGFHADFAA